MPRAYRRICFLCQSPEEDCDYQSDLHALAGDERRKALIEGKRRWQTKYQLSREKEARDAGLPFRYPSLASADHWAQGRLVVEHMKSMQEAERLHKKEQKDMRKLALETIRAEACVRHERRSALNAERRLQAEDNYRQALDILSNFSRSTNGGKKKKYGSQEDFAEVRRIYKAAHALVWSRQNGWARNDAVKRARRKGAENEPSTEETRSIYRRAKDPAPVACFWCHRPTKVIDRDVDHVVPLAKGGTNHHTNLAIACKRCNNAKRDLMPEVFIRDVLPGLLA